MKTILGTVKKLVREDHSRTITYVNAHCINLSKQNLKYHDAINQADIVYSDGISIVWASRLLVAAHL
jgi:UDP-N-acetyl-D-mannosaminuronic acid transferase (WecB/TagA/CpsF family)